MTTKKFENAVIFDINDVKDDFLSCVASAIDECDEITILVESQQGIDRIAEAFSTYEGEKSELHLQIHDATARQYGIKAKTTEVLLNIAAIIRNNTRASLEESLKIVTTITENYIISHK